MTASLNAANLITVMLESPNAIANADGDRGRARHRRAADRHQRSLRRDGRPGSSSATPRVAAAYERMIAACREHGKWPGMGGVYDEPLMQRYIGMGARFILAGGDLGFLMGAADGPI